MQRLVNSTSEKRFYTFVCEFVHSQKENPSERENPLTKSLVRGLQHERKLRIDGRLQLSEKYKDFLNLVPRLFARRVVERAWVRGWDFLVFFQVVASLSIRNFFIIIAY
jgi:hypothetical protein